MLPPDRALKARAIPQALGKRSLSGTANPSRREWELACVVVPDSEYAEMKSHCALLLLLLTRMTALAEFKFPAGVFRIAQLNDAMNEAAKQKKPLFFVHSDETYTRSQMPELLQDALKAGNDWSVTVFVSLSETYSLPPPVLSAPKGGYLPIVFISTPEGDKVFKVIMPPTSPITPQAMRKHVRAEINACKPEIAAWFAAKPPHGPELPGDKKLIWPMKGNTGREEVFLKVKNEKLYFRGEEDEQGPGFGTPLDGKALREHLRGAGKQGCSRALPVRANNRLNSGMD